MTALAKRRIGKTAVEVTVLGLGGGPIANFFDLIPEGDADATLEDGYAAGIRYFDTSPLYGLGLSEHRFGHILRQKPKDDFVISTKVGRLLKPERPEKIDRGLFKGGLNFSAVFDYSYDACMRSLEDSYQRLGMNEVDVVLIHDVDIWTHGTREAYDRRFGEAMAGSYRALDQLRRAGAIKAIGVGVNDTESCMRFAGEGDFDCFLLAGRYTLLEQHGLGDLLPLAEKKQFSILLGGPFNSGILATGARPGARYNYLEAPPEIMKRVSAIEEVCKSHDVPLAAAAIQFPLGHPSVASIVPGAVSSAEAKRNVDLITQSIPARLWEDLKTAGLLDRAAPVPTA